MMLTTMSKVSTPATGTHKDDCLRADALLRLCYQAFRDLDATDTHIAQEVADFLGIPPEDEE
jgi:hypothetical protein